MLTVLVMVKQSRVCGNLLPKQDFSSLTPSQLHFSYTPAYTVHRLIELCQSDKNDTNSQNPM